MEIVYKREEFSANSGLQIFVEQYAEKPNFVKFWRYGANNCIWKDMLLTKPNKSRLIKTY